MGVLDGVRVVELSSWVFVPSAGAVMAEWGAEVVKVEHPVYGDPVRGLVHGGGTGDLRLMFEFANRGKRSIGIDLKSPAGMNVLRRLISEADVFLTNFLPPTLRALELEADDLRTLNPRTVFARGSATGTLGPEADKGGFDAASYWSRSGIQSVLSEGVTDSPLIQRGAFGDIMAGLTLAGSISAALFQRERTGHAPVVDLSLLGLGIWNLTPDVILADWLGDDYRSVRIRQEIPNPLVCTYRTADDRWIMLNMIEAERYWSEVCQVVGRLDLAADPRFADARAISRNAVAGREVLEAVFGDDTLESWKVRLGPLRGVWSVVQTPTEVHYDPQALANGYIADLETALGQKVRVPTNPVRFDTQPVHPVRAPEHGEHTEMIMMALGYDWDTISALKAEGSIL
jgi:crotonobetainyl-CoA:carnitine CoA-transferase CaiB-like acyl-CoA transferase